MKVKIIRSGDENFKEEKIKMFENDTHIKSKKYRRCLIIERNKEMQKFIDNFTKKSFGKSLTEAEKEKVCVLCHRKIETKDFKDELSIKEYGISRMCQKCQDNIWGKSD